MNLLKIKLLVIAIMMFVASSAFAALSYDVAVDTSILNGTDGYLYFQYLPVNATDSSAMVSGFSGGLLAPAPSVNVVDGSAVSGSLPGTVTFANTNGINDYNHAINFGNTINFHLSFNDPASGGQPGGSSTFSLGLYQDEFGASPLLGGTLFNINLMNDGSTSTETLASQASVSVSSVPLPAAAWLFGSGLAGLFGLRRREQK
jgi:hypothetical protein